MSDTNPFKTMFDLQRTAVKQTQKMTLDSIEAQKKAYDAFADSMENYQSFSEQNAEFTKNTWMAFFDSLETSMPEGSVDFDELRTFVEEQVDTTTESQDEILQGIVEAMEDSNTAVDSYYDNYAEVVESSFESFLEAHEQLSENVTAAAEEVDVTPA